MVDDKKFGQEGQMIKRIAIAVLALFGLVTSTQAQELAAAYSLSKDPCKATIESLLRDGGASFQITKVVPNIEYGRMSGQNVLDLSYQYAHGFFGPDSFWREDVLRDWERWINGGRAWLVIANRSTLPQVQSGEWNQTIQWIDSATMEVLDETIWFGMIVAVDGQKCQRMSVAKGLFKENYDLPKTVWPLLVPKTPPKAHLALLD
jgi:hypothetical protein